MLFETSYGLTDVTRCWRRMQVLLGRRPGAGVAAEATTGTNEVAPRVRAMMSLRMTGVSFFSFSLF